jgi:hypothetical protein
MNSETPEFAVNRPQLRVPLQSAAVVRRPVASGLNDGSGVQASAWYDTLLQHAPDIISGIGKVASWF